MIAAISVSTPQTIPSADSAASSWKSTAWKALKIGAAVLGTAAVAGAIYYYFKTPLQPSLVSDIADRLGAQTIPVQKFTVTTQPQPSELLKMAGSSEQDPLMGIARQEQCLAIGTGRHELDIAAGVCHVFDNNSQWKISHMFADVVAHDVSQETHDSKGNLWDWYRYPKKTDHSGGFRYGVTPVECRRREYLPGTSGDVFDSLGKNTQSVFVPNPPKIDSGASTPHLPGPSGERSVLSSATPEAPVAKTGLDGHFTTVEKPGFTFHRFSEYTNKPHHMYLKCDPQGAVLQCQGFVDHRYQYVALEDSSGRVLEALCDNKQCVGSQSLAPTILPELLNEGVHYDSRIAGSTSSPLLLSGEGHPPARTKPTISV